MKPCYFKSSAIIDTETVVKAIKQSDLKSDARTTDMNNRYDKIPDYKVIESVMQQELTDKQIAHVKSEIETAVVQNKRRAYINLDGFNHSQKIKLVQVLSNKDYQIDENSNWRWSLLVNLLAPIVRFKQL
ncbi:hypothetical protein [Lactiplantibacillus plantarum]|uniref:hypothetical protein n=1 Tax=Lactiplantibacillus plantarum TaxID=1590 RepID=UPI000AEC3E74|nr:hypothetical protein [Lactiplantibacillus plantarum]